MKHRVKISYSVPFIVLFFFPPFFTPSPFFFFCQVSWKKRPCTTLQDTLSLRSAVTINDTLGFAVAGRIHWLVFLAFSHPPLLWKWNFTPATQVGFLVLATIAKAVHDRTGLCVGASYFSQLLEVTFSSSSTFTVYFILLLFPSVNVYTLKSLTSS